ncbi:MAG: sugar porter family MFS transporter [Moorea sp. SIO2I5]|nr:sugar porter family MFS transporter [Moorena sp. SIO2I5]
MINDKQEYHISFVLLISGVAAIGGFLFGFDSAVINGTITALQKAFNSTSVGTGFSVSSMLLGSAVGAFYAGQMADWYGRKKVMLMTAALFTISAIGSGIAIGIWDFVVYRLVGGIAVGAASVISPAYIAEVSPAHLRGRLGSLQQLAIVIGIFIAFVSNYLISMATGSPEAPLWFSIPAWRWMFWMELIPATVYWVGAWFIPESPRFLVSIGRLTKAAAVFAKIESGDVQAKVLEIQQTVLKEHKPKLSDLIGKNGMLLPIVWLGMGLSIFQQFVGINVVFYYGNVLWQEVGFSEGDSLLINVITGAINLLTTLLAIAYIDKFGRKPLLLIGSIGMTLTLGIMAFIFTFAHFDSAGELILTHSQGIVALLAANLYVFCFGFSWGPVVWVMLGEMFNNQIRGSALSVGASTQWLANFFITITFPILLTRFGLGTAYGLYTIAAAISFFLVVFAVRETKGKELEAM